jgi:hypothetical protein
MAISLVLAWLPAFHSERPDASLCRTKLRADQFRATVSLILSGTCGVVGGVPISQYFCSLCSHKKSGIYSNMYELCMQRRRRLKVDGLAALAMRLGAFARNKYARRTLKMRTSIEVGGKGEGGDEVTVFLTTVDYRQYNIHCVTIHYLLCILALVSRLVKFRNSDPQPPFSRSFGVAGSHDSVNNESALPPHSQTQANAIVCVASSADNNGRVSIIS